jgi:hypothetical protein
MVLGPKPKRDMPKGAGIKPAGTPIAPMPRPAPAPAPAAAAAAAASTDDDDDEDYDDDLIDDTTGLDDPDAPAS